MRLRSKVSLRLISTLAVAALITSAALPAHAQIPAASRMGEVASTTTALTSSLNPSTGGQTVTFTATVSASGGGTPAGTVTFYNGSTSIGAISLSSGVARLNDSALVAGTHSITATYNGSAADGPSTSAPVSQVVNLDTTTTALSTSPNPSTSGQSVTMTATVTPGNGIAAMGTVSFYSDSTLLGNASLSSGAATLSHAFANGTYSLTAKYTGSNYKSGSTSSVVTQTVNPNQAASATALVTSLNPSTAGASVTFTATVTPAGPPAPTGTVAFASNGATISGCSAVTLTASRTAACPTTALTVGTDSIIAVYSGDSNYLASTSATLSQVVNQAATSTTTTLASSLNPSTGGQTVTFTAKVIPQSGTGTPTGTVTFYNGSTAIGTITLSSGVAALRYASLVAGTHSITATYNGSTTYGTSTSAAVSQVVNLDTTTTTLTTSPNPSTSGQSVMLTATVTPGNGVAATGTVSFYSSATLLGNIGLSSGTGTLDHAFAAGTYSLTTKYTGSNYKSGSTSSVVMQTVSGSAPLTITTTSCPGGTQGAAYAGCTIVASGGVPPYTYSVGASSNYPSLPEGMSLSASTGSISSSLIGGQGTYSPEFAVSDSTGTQATAGISIALNGSNAFLAGIFPSTSMFHHRVDAATTDLPVDTSPAAPIHSGYQSATVKPFFGNNSDAPFPNGIPAIEVPYNQADVSVTTTLYQSYFTSGPIPAYAPVEGTSNSTGDRHVLVYLEAGDGNNPALYEMWQGIYEDGPWTDSSNALWPNANSNDLTPQGNGTSDAAGLPVAPLLANADEVIGTGTPTAPNGTIQHPIRFTLNHMLNYWVWPATQTAGVGSCTASGGGSIPVESEISQSSPPESCTMTGPAGEIYRLKASVATPVCASTSPQAAIIITAFRNYGIILADNGDSGGLIGTPDARWNDNDLECITSLTLSDFEPVNVSSLIVSNDSGATSH